MTREHLIDAIGLLDDELIREAEEYSHPRRQIDYRPWISLAACLAVVVTIGYGVAHLQMGGGSSMNGGAASRPAASNGASQGTGPADMEALPPSGEDLNCGTDSPQAPDAEPDSSGGFDVPSSAGGPAEHDFCAAIMVDGLLYWSTDTPVPGEPDPSIIQTVTSYTDTQPEEDGQTNFDRGLTTRYAMTDLGLVVLIDHEWVLFDPIPPWER